MRCTSQRRWPCSRWRSGVHVRLSGRAHRHPIRPTSSCALRHNDSYRLPSGTLYSHLRSWRRWRLPVTAWLQWRSVSIADRQVPVVDTPRLRVERFRGRMGLLSVAAFPMFGGFAVGAATSSSYTMGERSCRPGTGVVVEICEQHSVETERIVREASSWSMPLVAAGSLLLLGTILWWIHASRRDQQIAVPEYRYVAPGPPCTRG